MVYLPAARTVYRITARRADAIDAVPVRLLYQSAGNGTTLPSGSELHPVNTLLLLRDIHAGGLPSGSEVAPVGGGTLNLRGGGLRFTRRIELNTQRPTATFTLRNHHIIAGVSYAASLSSTARFQLTWVNPDKTTLARCEDATFTNKTATLLSAWPRGCLSGDASSVGTITFTPPPGTRTHGTATATLTITVPDQAASAATGNVPMPGGVLTVELVGHY